MFVPKYLDDIMWEVIYIILQSGKDNTLFGQNGDGYSHYSYSMTTVI